MHLHSSEEWLFCSRVSEEKRKILLQKCLIISMVEIKLFCYNNTVAQSTKELYFWIVVTRLKQGKPQVIAPWFCPISDALMWPTIPPIVIIGIVIIIIAQEIRHSNKFCFKGSSSTVARGVSLPKHTIIQGVVIIQVVTTNLAWLTTPTWTDLI